MLSDVERQVRQAKRRTDPKQEPKELSDNTCPPLQFNPLVEFLRNDLMPIRCEFHQPIGVCQMSQKLQSVLQSFVKRPSFLKRFPLNSVCENWPSGQVFK